MADWKTDDETLADQYGDTENLDARVALHERYSTADRAFHEWIDATLAVAPGDRVLTLGCGTGDVWPTLGPRLPEDAELVLSDRSAGMVAEAREALSDLAVRTAFARIDAQALPLADDSVDVVTANHMLYHVPDRERAIAEIARVLRPDGTLYATTNGAGHMRELLELLRETTGADVLGPSEFTLENGRAQLERSFGAVERIDYDDGLRVDDVAALVAYARSRPDVPEDRLDAVRAAAEDRMDGGVFAVEKNTGLFVARDPD